MLFLSHAWGSDEGGRDVHAWVVELDAALRARGVRTWLDEHRLVHDVDACMARGIDECRAVVVVVTRRYCEKVSAAASDPTVYDNCHKEFAYACLRGKPLLPVILEASMRRAQAWPPGVVTMHLGTHLYVDASGDDATPDAAARRLLAHLARGTPRHHRPAPRHHRPAPRLGATPSV